jgi:glyoxylase I family protein
MSTTTQSTRTAPSLVGIQHLGLTVSDVAASEAWYAKVLGLVRAFVEPHASGDGYAVVMTRPNSALFFGLDHHPDADQKRFSPLRTGLDHVAFGLDSREAIDEWIYWLDTLGVEHEALVEVAEPVPHAMVVLHDPDGIPVELFWVGI